MFRETKSRFKGAEEALRFYFRLRDLLHRGRARRLVADELPADACSAAASAIDDYQSIGWCMRGLDEVGLWLLSELYGPTCFGVHRRTFSQARRAGRQEFPHREFRLREVALIHADALGVVKRGLRELGMIPSHQMKPMRECRRVISIVKRAHLRGNRAASADSAPVEFAKAGNGLFRGVGIPVRLEISGGSANRRDQAQRER